MTIKTQTLSKRGVRNILVAGVTISLLASHAWAAWQILHINEIIFNKALTLFHGDPNEARLVLMGKLKGGATSLDMWPVNDTLPREHALTETVWYRTRIQDWPRFERINITALAGGQYRFGVERGGGGEFRPILFCFEDVKPGQAYCPLRIDPVAGVLLCDANNNCQQIGG